MGDVARGWTGARQDEHGPGTMICVLARPAIQTGNQNGKTSYIRVLSHVSAPRLMPVSAFRLFRLPPFRPPMSVSVSDDALTGWDGASLVGADRNSDAKAVPMEHTAGNGTEASSDGAYVRKWHRGLAQCLRPSQE